MVKTLLKLAVVLVIGLFTYNLFFGSAEEKEASRQVVGQVRDLGASVFDLLASEKQKLSEGKYEEALSSLKEAIGLEREQATALGHDGHECLGKCDFLHEQQLAIEQQFETIKRSTTMTEAERTVALQEIHDKIASLTSEAESLAQELRR